MAGYIHDSATVEWWLTICEQDENKKLDDTEKKARLIVNERLDSLLYDIQDVMAAKGNPRSEKLDIDLDEA